MNKEILEQEKPMEQIDDLKIEQKMEDGEPVNQEQIETEKSLDKTKGELDEVYKKQEEDSKQEGEQGKMSAREFFNEAKRKEENIKLPVTGKVAEFVSNTGSSQEVRNKTAKEKMPEVIKVLGEMGDSLENIKNNIETALSLGAGLGENIGYLVKELEIKNAIGIDKSTVASKKVQEEMGDKLTWIKGDALEEIKCLKDNSFNLSELTAYLQVLNREDKIKILREAGRVSELVVIIDELKRDGLGGFRDLFMNKLYNAGMGKYEVLEEGEWKEIFKEAGLVVVEEIFNKFGKNDFVTVLKKAEEKVEE